MRKNKTGGRKYFTQRIVESAYKNNGTINPKAGNVKQITHRLSPK